MAILEDVNSRSEDERDEGLDEDIEALRAACLLTGNTPDEEEIEEDVHNDATQISVSIPSDKNDNPNPIRDDDDDFELVRSIKKKFSIPPDDGAVFMKPLNSLPPFVASDGENDDFETLRVVRRRFCDYDADLENSEAPREPLLSSEEACNIYQPSEIPCSGTQNQSSKLIKWHQSEAGFPNPEAARLFVEALRKNRSCQKFIRSKLLQIEAKIEENKKLKERVKILKDFQVACKQRAGRAVSLRKDPRIQLISVPKFRNSQTTKANSKKAGAISFGPVENSHVAKYRMAMKRFPLCLSRPRWTQTEKDNLWKGIKQQFQEMLLQESIEGFSASGDSNDLDDIMASIADFEVTPENVRTFLPKVDWERLASTYVTGRSGAECEQRWLNVEDPLINHSPWAKNEDKKLLYILQQGGIYNWINISITLATNRTPFQCLVRFQRSLNANIMKRDWTREDDDQLRTAVEAFGANNWQLIAFNMEGRTGTQCSNRWLKTLNPARKRVGRWTVEEDKRLKVALLLFGAKTWQKIAQFIPGRTQAQCRERWVNCLDPSLNLKAWTEEEDCQLKAAVEEYGHCWSKVAASMPGRTDSKCLRRWKVLFPHEVPLIQAAKKIKRSALISNFVDRESERPALDHNDFVALPGPESVLALESGTTAGKEKKSRRKPKLKAAKDLVPCDNIPKRRSSKRSRSEAQICRGGDSRIQIADDGETCGEDGTISQKKKSTIRKCSKKNHCESTDLGNNQLIPEDSTTSMITESEDKIEDGTVLRRKRKAPYRRLKKNYSINIDSGNVSLLPEESTTLRITVGDDNTANCGEDDAGSRKKKRMPNKRLKNNQSTNSGDIPLLPEDLTVGDDNIPNCREDDTGARNKKRTPKKRLMNNQSTNADSGDIPLLPEDLTVGDDKTANCGEDDSILGRKEEAPSRRLKKIQCTDSASGDQDISLVTEDSTVLRIGNGDVSIEKSGAISGMKKRVSKRNPKYIQSTNTISGSKDVSEKLAILKITKREKSSVNQGDAPRNEKSASNKRLKRNRSTEHDSSLMDGDLTIASIADAISRKKKRSINKRLKTNNNCIQPASANIDNSLCPEDTAIRINDSEDNYNNKVVDGDGNVVLTKDFTEREMPNS
ncbi:hypothetical protein MKX03_024290 [Papaver bracteatum]|nr:hypothetical protein MKX03_024290 [Papaver bracteatum]